MTESQETDRIGLLRKQTEEVKGIAHQNVQKVISRGDNLSDLQDRAENLRLTAGEFDTSARRLKRKLCWQNIKLWIVMLFILLVILITLIVALVVVTKEKK